MTIEDEARAVGLLGDDGLFEHTRWSRKIYTGEWVTPWGGDLEVTDKATGELLGVVGQASAEDVREATKRAAEAQPAWASTPVEARASILRRAAHILESHQELL